MIKKTVVRYTLDECVKCLKCVRTCPTSALSLVDNRIVINDERCVNCGHCIRTRHHDGLQAHGSPLSAIKDYDYTVCLVPSALTSHCGSLKEAGELFAAIKNLGFDEVIDMSDEEGFMMHETFRIADDMVTTAIITSFCPVINRLIENNYPMLMEHLAPLKYPNEISAHYARNRLKDKGNVGIFSLCECEAKLNIAKHPFGNMQYETDHAISIIDIYPLIQHDKSGEALDVHFSRSGLQSCNPALMTRKSHYLIADGFDKVSDILDKAEFDLLKSFNLLYLFTCFNGCAGGNLLYGSGYTARNNIQALSESPKAENVIIPFEDLYCEDMFLTKEEQHNLIEKLAFFAKVNDELEHLPGLDCNACGMPSCRIMAEEIIKGNMKRSDCRILAAKDENNDDK